MKRLLIVSPHFPPINAPDMQRVRMALPYYRAAGWEPVVLAVKPEQVEGVREPELLETIPADVPVHYCDAYSTRWTRRFGVGNVGHRSWRFLAAKAAELVRRERFDLAFFSNTQFVTFPLGMLWRRRFGLPFVLDLQDPWRTNYYERVGSRRPPGGWKYQFARLQAQLMEGPTIRRAAGVMSVSGNYLDALRARYPDFEAPTDVIGFGASRLDLERARALPASAHGWVHRPGDVHLLYTGVCGGVMAEALHSLFAALREFRQADPEAARRLRFHFYGTSYAPAGRGEPSVQPIAAACGVADQVDEVAHRLGHLECLRLQSEADVLLLPGSSDPAYSPSKIYPYFLAGKPILGVVLRDSVVEHLLESLQGAYLVRFGPQEANVDRPERLRSFFTAAAAGNAATLVPARREAYFNEHYLAESLARRQAALFERAVAHVSGR